LNNIITEERLKKLHESSSLHREIILGGDDCSCFGCESVYNPREVVRWCDEGQTAICPKCGIDSVLPGEVVPELLNEMYKYYFEIKQQIAEHQ